MREIDSESSEEYNIFGDILSKRGKKLVNNIY